MHRIYNPSSLKSINSNVTIRVVTSLSKHHVQIERDEESIMEEDYLLRSSKTGTGELDKDELSHQGQTRTVAKTFQLKYQSSNAL